MRALKTPGWTLFQFSFGQLIKIAIIVGVLSGGQLMLQGLAYEKGFNTHAKQAAFAASLNSAPALGFIYGDPHDLQAGTPGYMVYRVAGFMGVVTAVWALMMVTKILRGAEEDGRYEVVRSGVFTARQATLYLVLGFAGVWWVALLISYALTMLGVRAGHIDTTSSTMLALNLAIFLPGLLFAGFGVLSSQLGSTRGRALLYGIVPAAALFLVRGVANINSDWHWLLNLTPFGWMELLDPLHGSGHGWLYVIVASAIALAFSGIWLAKRDYDSSIIKAASSVRSRFVLLGSSWQLALRQNFWVLLGWVVGMLLMVSLVAGLASTAVGAIKAAGAIGKKAAAAFGGNTDNLKIAYIGVGILLAVMVLLIMSITLLSQIRRDEAKQYLDNILVATQKRSVWLAQRLLLGFGIVLGVSLLAGVLIQILASIQNIPLDFGKVMATSICAIGSVAFMLGLGTLLYGFVPRLTVFVMYAAIVWSFVITLVDSVYKLDSTVMRSSLFHYTNFNLNQWPDWGTFGWFILISVCLATVGVWRFTRRDIVPE